MPKGAARALRAKRPLVALRTPSRPKPYSLFQKRESLCLPDGKRKLISNAQRGYKGFKGLTARTIELNAQRGEKA